MDYQQREYLQKFGIDPTEIVDQEGRYWLTSEMIGTALGYADPRKGIMNLYLRHKEELEPYTSVLNLRTTSSAVDERGGGIKETTIFNTDGAMMLCMLSSTPKAAEFRRGVVGVLKQLERGRLIPIEQCKGWRERCIDMDMRAAVARTRLTWPQYERLYILRKMGLTQAEAGKLYGVSRDTIARLERTCRRLYETTYHLPGHPAPSFGVESPPRRRPAQRQLSLLEGGAR